MHSINPVEINWSNIDTVLFDCDGVIVHGDESPIPNSIPTVNTVMHELRKRVYFVSNNSSKDRADFVNLFARLGVVGCKEEQIICTSWLAIEEVSRCHSAYVIGSEALVKCLVENTSALIESSINDNSKQMDFLTPFPQAPDLVLVGYDERINFYKIAKAMNYINQGARFLATSNSGQCSSAIGLAPGTGAIVAAIEKATGKQATILGKPNIDASVFAKLGIDPKRTLMVGDRVDSDVLFGKRLGMQTALVETGVQSRKDIKDIQPDYVFASASNMISSKNCLKPCPPLQMMTLLDTPSPHPSPPPQH